MKRGIVVLLLCIAVRCFGTAHSINPIVARVLGKPIHADSIGLKFDMQNHPVLPKPETGAHGSNNPVDMLILTSIKIIQDNWLTEHKLHATSQELHEFHAFVRKSGAKQLKDAMAQRTALEKSLKNKQLAADERAQAEQQRLSLDNSIAQQKRQMAADASMSDAQLNAAFGAEVDRWRFNKEIYRLYGGDVNDAGRFGLIPVGAIERMMLEYNGRGQIEIIDPALKAAYWQRIGKKSPSPVPANKIDWTPYWKK